MSLQESLNQTTIIGRKRLLQKFLKEHGPGELTDEEDSVLKKLFENFYTPDIGQSKYTQEEIQRFYIGKGSYNTTCFHLRLYNGFDDVATLKRLSGENRTNVENLRRALRYTIEDQIQSFRMSNPLEPNDICPVLQIPLGNDAQVDHFNPTFSQLLKDWIKENPLPVVVPGPKGSSIYILEEPYEKSWKDFHKKHAHLRWLSKKGNMIAHKL